MYFVILGKGSAANPPTELPTHDQKELGSLLSSMGAAISAWQMVEFAVFQVFEYLVASPHKRAIAAAFYEVVAFQARLKMVNAALDERFPNSEIQTKWLKVTEKISRSASKRNEIAHAVLYFEPGLRPGKQLYFGPSIARPDKFDDAAMYKDDGRLNLEQKDKMHEKELTEKFQSFMNLQVEISRFLQSLPNSPFPSEPPKSSDELSDDKS